jgi:hypothetical protein
MVLTGTNIPASYANLEGQNFQSGGHSEFVHEYEPQTDLWKTTIKPYNTQNPEEWRIIWADWLGRKVREKHPELRRKLNQANFYFYDYDTTGRLERRTLAGPNRQNPVESFRSHYDALGRLKSVSIVSPDATEDTLLENDFHPTNGQLIRTRRFLQGEQPVVTEYGDFDELQRPQSLTTHAPATDSPNAETMWVQGGAEQELVAFWSTFEGIGSSETTQYNIRIRPRQYANTDAYDLVFANIPGSANHSFPLNQKTFLAEDFFENLNQLHPTAAQEWEDWIEDSSSPYVLNPEFVFDWQFQAWDPVDFESSPTSPWKRFNPLPDLVTTHFQASLNLVTGQYDINLEVFNQGNLKSGTAEIQIILADAPDLGGVQETVFTGTTPIMNPGMEYTFPLSLALDRRPDPVSDVPTLNYLVVLLDPSNQIKEGGGSFEENNQQAFFLGEGSNPNPLMADLYPQNIDHIFTYIGGGVWDAYGLWNIVNSSDQNSGQVAGASSTQLSLSARNYLGHESQTPIGRLATPELAPGQNITQAHWLFDTRTPHQIPQQFMIVAADAANQVEEGSETNNTLAYGLEGLPGTGPDLKIRQVFHDGFDGLRGEIAGVQFTVENIGVWDAGVSKVSIYLSEDDQWEPDTDLLVAGSFSVPNLPVDAISSPIPNTPITLSIPAEYQSATNYLIFVADVDNDVEEGSLSTQGGENNNLTMVSFRGFPDLLFESIDFNEADGFNMTLRNDGNIASLPAFLTLLTERGEATTLSDGADVLFDLDIPPLQPGETLVLSTPPNWQIPRLLEDQTIWFLLDHENYLPEADEDNNTSFVFIPGIADQTDEYPDIVPLIWTWMDGAGAVRIEYANNSVVGFSDPWVIELLVSVDDQLSPDDQPLSGFSNFRSGIPNQNPITWIDYFSPQQWYSEWLLPHLEGVNCPDTCTGCPPSCSEWRPYESATNLYFFIRVDATNNIAEGQLGGEQNNVQMFSWRKPSSGCGDCTSKAGMKTIDPLPDFQILNLRRMTPSQDAIHADHPTSWELTYRLSNPYGQQIEIQNLSYFIQESGRQGLNRTDRMVYTEAVKWPDQAKGQGVSGGSLSGFDKAGGFRSNQLRVLLPGETVEIIQSLSLPSSYDQSEYQISIYTGARWVNSYFQNSSGYSRVKGFLNFKEARQLGHTHNPQNSAE